MTVTILDPIYTPEEYIDLVSKIHKLITSEMEEVLNTEEIYMVYPKVVNMYEFFRLLRGEAFYKLRPPTPKKQREFYKMEDEIKKKLDQIKIRLDFNDEKVRFYIDEAQKQY